MSGGARERRAAVLEALGRLDGTDAPVPVAESFRVLAGHPHFELPLPGAGNTLERWQILSEVAAHDLSVVKLFEGHADALAILGELKHEAPGGAGATWGTWAAESPGGRVLMAEARGGRVRLDGVKHWCSGARSVSHALLTTWRPDGSGPYLATVALDQPGVSIDGRAWRAVGMADSGSVDVRFEDALAEPVGERGDYVSRPGFMHGGAGIAACWWGGARALAEALRRAVAGAGAGSDHRASHGANQPFRVAALGKVDVALVQTAALLREAAAWIDRWPRADPTVQALRVRQSAEACARTVLDEAGRALGATPFCRDRHFARMAADLAVFTRQSLAERDFQSLGHRIATAPPPWHLDPDT